ncbi:MULTISPECIES: IS1096 element passenger TnpR family protein [unclassified Gordonia (in: high G+C Gram-positive bacteria)]
MSTKKQRRAKQAERDGAGTAPLEDVGDPPGWERFLAAVTPSHPDHQDLRQWAGLPAGVSVDATIFDVGAVNRQLKRLGLR